tara:strand:- start:2109 stop:2309 length:201 start_codon:yes stop_codon:yes gene_type:complete
MQSKKDSLKESITNVIIGYMVALVSQILIFPIVGVDASIDQNLMIGVYFTIISLLRSYLVRRYFNK